MTHDQEERQERMVRDRASLASRGAWARFVTSICLVSVIPALAIIAVISGELPVAELGPMTKAGFALVLLSLVDLARAEPLRILLTNDDGFDSPGITAMQKALTAAGHDVILVAPLNNQSGSGMRVSTTGVLDYQEQSGKIHRRNATGISVEDVPIEKGEPLANELASFIECVTTRNEPMVSGQHASEALRLAARSSHAIREAGG